MNPTLIYKMQCVFVYILHVTFHRVQWYYTLFLAKVIIGRSANPYVISFLMGMMLKHCNATMLD